MYNINKIKALAKEKGVKQNYICAQLGLQYSYLNDVEKGKNKLTEERLRIIADILGTTPEYLKDETDVKEKAPLSFEDKKFPPNIISFADLQKKKVPILGDIACGEPIYADELHGDYIICDVDADFALTCKGDSMMGARIHDGDLVFIRNQSEVENGSIAAVIINDEATLKRVYYYPEQQKLILNPENPAYAPLVFVGEELSDVRILGKAVAFQSRL
ncbi:MAG: helix-turn-helix domain-containing protein [Clostridia bacterium]|nr:helix-turn-helix domain-containing protein [Clostridia bacterium]